MVNTELENVKLTAKEKVNREITEAIETDKEFYYLVGQCISFMCNRYIGVNKALKKNGVSKQAMLSKNAEYLKNNLKTLFGKCSNMLYMEDKKFNNAYAMLIGYVPEDNKIDQGALQFGYLENCIL